MTFAVGSLVRARGREWVVLPDSGADLLMLRPLGGADDEVTGVYLPLEPVEPAHFALPDPVDVGDFRSARLLRDAVRLGFRASAGPFRSFARIAVEPRPYQLVPLLMALRLDPVRLLVADDVGIGKTIEACLIARELLDRGEVRRLAVLCPPHLAEQWQEELDRKFHIEAELVLASTATRLERDCAVGQSLFDVYPHVVVSTDFIKAERRREEFLRTCPELVIVDEAHTCAFDAGSRGRHQRHELLRRLAGDPRRHLILVTATPHSGKEEAFRSLLALLDPAFASLPEDLSGRENEPHRRRLAAHFVQRRRGDIRRYLDTETLFPARDDREETYSLSSQYKALFERALSYARETVRDPEGNRHRQRVRWWSALALLRSLASSPAAAAATLRSRARAADTGAAEEADEIGQRSVLDQDDVDSAEDLDVVPGGDSGEHAGDESANRRRLLDMAGEAETLKGSKDAKLVKAAGLVEQLLAEGHNPIVFCRFIPTAEYVAEYLRGRLKKVEIAAVTGTLPPAEREARVAELAEAPRHVLVCTDCLSEGINLQNHFDAVVHYDLSWNPTRHEQREGRVDRYGQPKKTVRVVTFYGIDNQIDGIVLDVLLRKHRTIRNSLGISVPVPVDTNQVIEAVFEGLLLRERAGSSSQGLLPGLEEFLRPQREDLHRQWDAAAAATERDRRSRTMFAQEAIKVEDVARELAAVRTAIGSGVDVRRFVEEALEAHGAIVHGGDPVKIDLHEVVRPLRETIAEGDQIVARFELPVEESVAYLERTHPVVERLAGYVMDTALDAQADGRARRAGAIRTTAVDRRTTLLLVRFRYHLLTRRGADEERLLAEDCVTLAFEGAPESPAWLEPARAEALLGAAPAGNVTADQARDFVARVVEGFASIRPHVDRIAAERGRELLDAHRRVRQAVSMRGVTPARRASTASRRAWRLRVPPRGNRLRAVARRGGTFITVRTEGGILPADLLQRIVEGDRDLGGLRPEDYHLSGERLNEAITRSWTRMKAAWPAFRAALARLPEGDLATSVTRERWLLPLFAELGYGRLVPARAVETDGKMYPVSHGWQHAPIHLVGCRLDLDRRTPGVAGAAKTSPHGLVQELLNRSKDNPWGLVSNGLRLRILRDNVSLTRQPYVEFDLASMMEGEVYADFVLLWLVCHQSRLEAERPKDCWLEKWSQTAREQGTRALDHLRQGVEEAIVALGRGFLLPRNSTLREHLRSGALDKQDYYRQLLRTVYRLLFLFVAEDRGLLLHPKADVAARERYARFYSTGRLRRLADRQRGTRHVDLWRGLALVFDALGNDAGCPALGLPALGSFLWSVAAAPDLAGCDLANRDLLDAVRALAFGHEGKLRRAVDYRNLGSEELGSIYEALLELDPRINLDAGAFELGAVGGHERKTTGSYYTPSSLIQCLLDSALNPVLDEASRKPSPEAAILDLKVCDPACGSGHFLIAAAHRIARRLAAVRTGDEEPSPEATRAALRDVISRCIYGVDVNDMAVELCKVSLWMEALQPGCPLSFLDHRIVCGNSLLGTTPALIGGGIPDGAFSGIEGDDKALVAAFRKRNRHERDGQMTLPMVAEPGGDYAVLSSAFAGFNTTADESIGTVHAKELQLEGLLASSGYRKAKLLADAWCAAFVWRKENGTPEPVTEDVFQRLASNPTSVSSETRAEIDRLAHRYRFLHWHLAFPDVLRLPQPGEEPSSPHAGWMGGFDVVLGNPPWERVTLKEKEWFESKDPEVARASTGAQRRALIQALRESNPSIYRAFISAKRRAADEKALLRNTGAFPLCGVGDVNTFAVFAELGRRIMRRTLGFVLPTGIVTTETTQRFVAEVVQQRQLVSVFDFDNRSGIFPAVQGNVRFCLLTLSRDEQRTFSIAAQLESSSELADLGRVYRLNGDDVQRISPNTLTLPFFVKRRDADLVKALYLKMRCLDEKRADRAGKWNVTLKRMLHMGDDSHLFRTAEQLTESGFMRTGGLWSARDGQTYAPLFEAKLTYQFDHRAGTFDGIPLNQRFGTHPATRDVSDREHCDPNFAAEPRYWVPQAEVIERLPGVRYLFGFRDAVSAIADSRSLVASILPLCAAGHTLCFLFSDSVAASCFLLAWFNAFATDYVFKLKATGGHASFFLLEQLPVPNPDVLAASCSWDSGSSTGAWVSRRVLELTFTARDLQSFARDCGYDGPPFLWDEERRFLIRCELDAAFFHLYGIARDDMDYVLESFPIVKREDVKRHSEYRTKRVILEIYDAMRKAAEAGKPYRTRVDPPPADRRLADVAGLEAK